MEVKVENGKLHIILPMNETPVESTTGKTLIVASSGGNRASDVLVAGKAVYFGVNAYIKK